MEINKKSFSGLLIVLLFIVIAGLVAYIVLPKNTKENTEPEKIEIAPGHKKVEDEEIIKKLSDKVDLFPLGSVDYVGYTYKGGKLTTESFGKEYVISYYLFTSTTERKIGDPKSFPDFETQILKSPYGYAFNKSTVEYVTKEEYVKTFKTLFGTEPKIEDVTGSMVYLPQEEIFVDPLEIEGGRANGSLYPEDNYVYLVEEDDNNYYVYYSNVILNGINVYKTILDTINHHPYIECDDFKPCDKAKDFRLTKDNYNEFEKYIMTFEKKDGDFFFKSLERVNK